MNILITGGTGFIGSALTAKLQKEGHTVTILSRKPNRIHPPLQGISSFSQLAGEDTFDAVINLAGEPIANRRWSNAQKRKIRDSRINMTQALIDYLSSSANKPRVLINGSAVGYYGLGDGIEKVDEESEGDGSFSSLLCQDWESVATRAEGLGIRTCRLRIGIVLGTNGGALGKMLTPFKLGLGGKIGGGEQWMPWIHRDDLIGIILFCLDSTQCSGPINATAPTPVTNRAFTQALGTALGRPTVFTMPTLAVRILMGQMGEELLLSGRRVIPTAISEAGFQFQYETLEKALTNIV